MTRLGRSFYPRSPSAIRSWVGGVSRVGPLKGVTRSAARIKPNRRPMPNSQHQSGRRRSMPRITSVASARSAAAQAARADPCRIPAITAIVATGMRCQAPSQRVRCDHKPAQNRALLQALTPAPDLRPTRPHADGRGSHRDPPAPAARTGGNTHCGSGPGNGRHARH